MARVSSPISPSVLVMPDTSRVRVLQPEVKNPLTLPKPRNTIAPPTPADDVFTAAGPQVIGSVWRGKPKQFDGAILGPDGAAYNATPAALDALGSYGKEPVIFVNGALTQPVEAISLGMEIAQGTGYGVVTLYNATHGLLNDILQTIGDKLHIGKDRASNSLKSLVLAELDAGKPVHIIGHSQGAAIVSRALGRVAKELHKRGLSQAQIDAKLQTIKVETMGGAASGFPDGPRYVHYVNTHDPIATLFGLGYSDDSSGIHPGRDAKIVRFGDGKAITDDYYQAAHMPGVYLKHFQDFDQLQR